MCKFLATFRLISSQGFPAKIVFGQISTRNQHQNEIIKSSVKGLTMILMLNIMIMNKNWQRTMFALLLIQHVESSWIAEDHFMG